MEIIVGVVVCVLVAVVAGGVAVALVRGRAEHSAPLEEAIRFAVEEQQRVADEQRRAAEGQRDVAVRLDQQVAGMVGEIRGLTETVQQLERERRTAQGGLTEQLRALHVAQESLRAETGNLATALRSPTTRGRWGEIQLRRVVEMAGMLPHCDFVEQQTVRTDDGCMRPDVVIRLPGAKQAVIDSKVPLAAFLDAVEASDEAMARTGMAAHARQVRQHVDALGSKAYWAQFPDAPDFVVMFVPGDQLLAAALEHDPSLMEHAVANRVLLATPVTLIALLRSITYGWQQESLAENARQIAQLGRQLQERLAKFASHLAKVGRSLDSAVGAYNEAVGSYESRVLVTGRKFTELDVSDEELEAPPPVDRRARSLAPAPELDAEDTSEVIDLRGRTTEAELQRPTGTSGLTQ